MNTKYIISTLIIAAIAATGCNKVLDKENVQAINPDFVWNDPSAANAYINEIYSSLMPAFSTNDGDNSDEATYANLAMPDVLKGTATIDTWNIWYYDDIRKLNVLLEQIDGGKLFADIKERIKGEAFFWRAWAYFYMVRAYGGVPLILTPQDPNAGNALFVSRNKTSECIAQIISDLDSAITLLPGIMGAQDLGRIDKPAASAFKGRVLLYYASPQFNPQNDVTRWQAAYEANKAALDICEANGKGLNPDFADIWYKITDESIMVHYYHYPEYVYDERGNRPYRWSNHSNGWDSPSLELVNAFPMKDGTKYDISKGYSKFWQNRDDRFYATVVYNGSPYYGIKDLVALGANMWTWHRDDYPSFEGVITSNTSFYRNKGIDKTIDQSNPTQASVPWIEIRFAEVLMNYGEAANEIGKADEALSVLRQIRKRAGVLPGANDEYGITATTKTAIRQAYMDERFVEFAFENKRFWDLRRWRRFDVLNDLKYHHGLFISLKQGEPAPLGKEDIDQIYDRFTYVVNEIDPQPIHVLDNYYFFGIPKKILDRNGNLKQTNGWDNGTFDPLQ